MDSLLRKLGIESPIIQAPMAGVSTPELAAAVSNAGGLGSIGVGATDAEGTGRMITAVKALTKRPFQVNVFCHQPAVEDATREAAWLAKIGPEFARFGAKAPDRLNEIYRSFLIDDAKLAVLLEERPAVVSFHFGLPDRERIAALHGAGITLFATATNLAEARLIEEAGIDAVVAQGYEAGGHRGVFQLASTDDQLGTVALTRLLVAKVGIPVISAGGIMDGTGIAAALSLGAVAAQLGTAFIGCPESSADAGYRAALFSRAAEHTIMTSVISGRPARCLANCFTDFGRYIPASAIPDYPRTYDVGKALHAAAKARGEFGFGAGWAGQGAPLARALPAAKLVASVRAELEQATSHR